MGITVLVKNGLCINTDQDVKKYTDTGWRVVSADEISAAGMTGYERLASPANTKVNPDGTITFTPPSSPSSGPLFAMLRSERDRRLAATDFLLMPDYPISDDQRAVVQAYRQALRDLPAQSGAPWDGGGEATPWPVMPAGLKI